MMRSLRCMAILVAVVGSLFGPWVLASTEPRAELEVRLDNDTALVGEPRRLLIDLRTPSWFRKVAPLPVLQIDGALVLMPQSFGASFSERRQGITYSVQRREVLLFPQQPGTLQIPAITLEAWVANEAEGGADRLRLGSQPLLLTVHPIPGLDTEHRVPVATGLTFKQSYSQDQDILKVGEGLTRSVEVVLDGAPGMFIPPLPLAEIAGVRSYRDQPEVHDRTNRGDYRGVRRESLTYLFEQAGEVSLPALELQWWNLSEQRLETATLPSRTLNIQASPQPSSNSHAASSDWRVLLLSLAVVATLALGYHHRFRRPPSAEQQAFKRLLQTHRQNDPQAFIGALYRWMDHASLDLSQLQQQQPLLAQHCQQLLLALYADEGSQPTSNKLAPDWRYLLKRLRARQLAPSQMNQSDAKLPPINPVGNQQEPHRS